jgi:hypothetical protein
VCYAIKNCLCSINHLKNNYENNEKRDSISLLSIGAICALMLVSACKKEAGPTGTAGKDGNANVKVFLFTDDTLSNAFL